MEKIIVIGDTHGRSFWKIPAYNEKWDKFIFIGDYFDSYHINGETQIRVFREICEFKEKNPDKVILLVGNHDGYIYDEMDQHTISGYQGGKVFLIKHILNTYKDLLQMAHYEGNILFTHAGVGETWFKKNIPEINEDWSAKYISEMVNDVWKYKPISFKFNGWKDSSGDEIGQTPIWIRPRALLADTKNIRKKGIIQVVGHTQVSKIDIEGSKKNTGGKLFMIDALETSREYLIIENGKFGVGSVK